MPEGGLGPPGPPARISTREAGVPHATAAEGRGNFVPATLESFYVMIAGQNTLFLSKPEPMLKLQVPFLLGAELGTQKTDHFETVITFQPTYCMTSLQHVSSSNIMM